MMEPSPKRPRLSYDEPPHDFELQRARRHNDLQLKSCFESIFEKYSRDFTEVADEIDLRTGEVLVNNGHLQSITDERDTGIFMEIVAPEPITPQDIDEEDVDDDDGEYKEDEEQNSDEGANGEEGNENTVDLELEDPQDADDELMITLIRRRREIQAQSAAMTNPQQKSDLPSTEAIVQQFGAEMGLQIAQIVAQFQTDESRIEPAWRTSGQLVPMDDSMTQQRPRMLRTEEDSSMYLLNRSSIWAPRPRGRPRGPGRPRQSGPPRQSSWPTGSDRPRDPARPTGSSRSRGPGRPRGPCRLRESTESDDEYVPTYGRVQSLAQEENPRPFRQDPFDSDASIFSRDPAQQGRHLRYSERLLEGAEPPEQDWSSRPKSQVPNILGSKPDWSSAWPIRAQIRSAARCWTPREATGSDDGTRPPQSCFDAPRGRCERVEIPVWQKVQSRTVQQWLLHRARDSVNGGFDNPQAVPAVKTASDDKIGLTNDLPVHRLRPSIDKEDTGPEAWEGVIGEIDQSLPASRGSRPPIEEHNGIHTSSLLAHEPIIISSDPVEPLPPKTPQGSMDAAPMASQHATSLAHQSQDSEDETSDVVAYKPRRLDRNGSRGIIRNGRSTSNATLPVIVDLRSSQSQEGYTAVEGGLQTHRDSPLAEHAHANSTIAFDVGGGDIVTSAYLGPTIPDSQSEAPSGQSQGSTQADSRSGLQVSPRRANEAANAASSQHAAPGAGEPPTTPSRRGLPQTPMRRFEDRLENFLAAMETPKPGLRLASKLGHKSPRTSRVRSATAVKIKPSSETRPGILSDSRQSLSQSSHGSPTASCSARGCGNSPLRCKRAFCLKCR